MMFLTNYDKLFIMCHVRDNVILIKYIIIRVFMHGGAFQLDSFIFNVSF